MANSVAAKFRIRENDRILSLSAPPGYRKDLGALPAGVTITGEAKDFQQIHWFVRNRAQLEKELSAVLRKLKPGVVAWVFYPKGSSGLQTDLTRDKGWDCLLSEEGRLSWINLVSFNDTWSAFGFRARTEEDRKKALLSKKEREIFKWIDPVKKTVKIPPELAAAFRRAPREARYFDSLAFSHRREYVEWIVEAKREETRKKRVEGTIGKLSQGLKNPADRGR